MAELLPVVTSLHLVLRLLGAERRMTFQVVAIAKGEMDRDRRDRFVFPASEDIH